MKQKEENPASDQVVNTKVDNLSTKIDYDFIVDLIKKYPNDYDLGGEIRKYYLSLKND